MPEMKLPKLEDDRLFWRVGPLEGENPTGWSLRRGFGLSLRIRETKGLFRRSSDRALFRSDILNENEESIMAASSKLKYKLDRMVAKNKNIYDLSGDYDGRD